MTNPSRRLGAAVVIALALAAATAHAGPRSTAVLEFRSGSSALPDIASRVSSVLSTRTSLRVVGGDQARQRYGEGLDRAVVECAGDAVCIGGIGARLGTDEVILVGVSELGDVIFTLQRVHAGDGLVDGRVAEALPADTVPSDDDLVGYLERVLPPEDFVRFGTIAIKVNVAGAEIWVGGTSRGRSPIAAIRVPAPSRYPIEIKKAGYAAFRAAVEISPDTEVNVDAELTRPGGKTSPWYSKWWVVATAGVVVAGAITTAVILTRDVDSVPITGHF